MADLEVLLQHGWALDSSMWRNWTNLSKQLSPAIQIRTADRGYFSSALINQSFFKDGNRKIVVAHSLGLHLIPESQLANSDLLVIIGSFVHFHDGTDRESRVSRLAVRRMLQKLEREPHQVVADFYENCGFPENYAAAQISRLQNLLLLKGDLELLDQSKLDPNCLLKPREVLILHGAQDAIAPSHHAENLKKLRPDSIVAIHSDGTHALPYDHPEWCLQQIESSLLVQRR
ncbi:MAG TPA: alpha/beta hydrolase [Drouetiella sp.]|jgi:pimeloyl-[acyl-carrier protein] methyl ester esterase